MLNAQRILVLTVFWLSLFPAAFGSSCTKVSGGIVATVPTSDSALGAVTGDLEGGVRATFSATPQSDGSVTLTLHHLFVTEGGDTLQTVDVGTLTPVAGMPGVFRMAVSYTIIGGSGKFAGATGTLANHGEADLTNGQLTLRYKGTVCVS